MSCASRSQTEGRLPRAGTGLLLLLLLACAPRVSWASKPRLRLERVEARCQGEPTAVVHFTELELEGVLRRRPPSEYRLVVDGAGQEPRPLQVSSFARSGRRLRLAVLIQSTASFATAQDSLLRGLRELLRDLPRDSRITLIGYDSQARRLLALGDTRQAVAALDSLETTSASVDLALDEALTLGLRSLGPAEAAQRRLLILVSDGVNRFPKRDLFRGLGSRASALEIPIHPIGFSPSDERGPLLNLGELAKRSRGTMRWAQRADDLPSQLANLGQEIREQLILRFPLPGGCRPAELQVTSGDLLSNAVKLSVAAGPSRRAAPGRSRAVLGLFLGGLLAAAVLLTLAARLLVRPRRREAPAGRPQRGARSAGKRPPSRR